MAKNKEVAETGAFDFDVTERPEHIGESKRGSENVRTEDLTIPRVDLVQSLSPQRKVNDPAYIEGASEGMLFNSVSSKLYGPSIIFIPCFFRKEWLIWKDRKKGGGFRGAFPNEAEATNALSQLEDRADCEILDTAQHFGLVVDPNGSMDNPLVEEAVISMSRTKLKASRSLNSLVSLAGGDRFSRVYRVEGVTAQNAAGEEYYNLKVTQLGYTPAPLFNLAEEVYGSVSAGLKDVSRSDGPKETPHEDEANAEF